VQRIGDGTLPKESFLHYIIQDYFFLQNYARAHAMGAYKSKLLAQSKEFADTVIAIAHETKLHIHVSPIKLELVVFFFNQFNFSMMIPIVL